MDHADHASAHQSQSVLSPCAKTNRQKKKLERTAPSPTIGQIRETRDRGTRAGGRIGNLPLPPGTIGARAAFSFDRPSGPRRTGLLGPPLGPTVTRAAVSC